VTAPTVVPITTQATLPTEPFVTVGEFRAHPTWLDTLLRPGDASQADQDAELFNILLMASESAENYCNQPLQAHIQTDYGRNFVDRFGRLKFHADHGPVRTVLSYSYASILGQVTSFTNPLWQPDGSHQVLIDAGAANTAFTGRLQFNAPPSTMELYTTLNYVAAYANATLTTQASSGSASITVTNPTGIFAGDTLRLWDPGKEESVTVSASWAGQNTYPYTSVAIPLTANLTQTHAAGVGVSGLGADLHLAVIYIAVDGLQRWGGSSSTWPGASVRSALGKDRKEMTPWLVKACDLLETYRAVK
jgi:hypothetical protein